MLPQVDVDLLQLSWTAHGSPCAWTGVPDQPPRRSRW